ncbi:Mediator of RNA polymerase II transcription subunit 6 [Sergentomyia squamirostris]
MMPGRLGMPIAQEPLWISWHDSNWIPILNPTNVMDYFSEKSNPFYDRTCNNELVKMQRQSLEHLNNMIGVEYILLHVQDPILYVIRKQHRHTPTEATPLADYYIIAGTVYQAPDLASVFNSRLLSAVHHLQSAFEESSGYSRYHPNKGYTWDFSSNKALTDKTKTQTKKEPAPVKEEASSLFQRKRVDMLLGELIRKFPLPLPPTHQNPSQQQQNNANGNIKKEPVDTDARAEASGGQETGAGPTNGGEGERGSQGGMLTEIKQEKSEMKPPPEKKMKFN